MACAKDNRSKFTAAAESQVIQVSNVAVGIEHCLALHMICAKGSWSKFTAGDESQVIQVSNDAVGTEQVCFHGAEIVQACPWRMGVVRTVKIQYFPLELGML